MRESEEERAYAEVLRKLVDNDPLIELVNRCWRTASNEPYSSTISIAQYSMWLLNIEGWWYLIFRTCDAIGAKLVVTFFKQWWLKVEVPPANPGDDPTYRDMTVAEKKDLFTKYGTRREPAPSEEVIRKEFVLFMRSQDDWAEKSYSHIAAGDIGPWPKSGTGDD